MIKGKYISSVIEAGIRMLKVNIFGIYNPVDKIADVAPFGIDGGAIAGMTAVYSETSTKGKPVVVGWINVNAVAMAGESRMYSTDGSGNLVYNIYQSGGKVYLGPTAVLGDYNDWLVNFNALKAGFDQLKNDFNTHSHLDPLSGPLPAPMKADESVPATTATIDPSKNESINTKS